MLDLEMNLNELMIPFARVKVIKRLLNVSLVSSGVKGYFISEEEMLYILEELGCEWKNNSLKMNSAHEAKMNEKGLGAKGVDNQELSSALPESLVEMVRSTDQNLIRCIFELKGSSLKEVAERYGGRSAAANLSNILAKSNADLVSMRGSTMQRLAAALECPVEWIEVLKHPEQMATIQNKSI